MLDVVQALVPEVQQRGVEELQQGGLCWEKVATETPSSLDEQGELNVRMGTVSRNKHTHAYRHMHAHVRALLLAQRERERERELSLIHI